MELDDVGGAASRSSHEVVVGLRGRGARPLRAGILAAGGAFVPQSSVVRFQNRGPSFTGKRAAGSRMIGNKIVGVRHGFDRKRLYDQSSVTSSTWDDGFVGKRRRIITLSHIDQRNIEEMKREKRRGLGTAENN